MTPSPLFTRLFEPGKIGKLELSNRMIMAPMTTRFIAPDGKVTGQLIDYYLARATGGVGLVVVESAYSAGGGRQGRVNIHDDKYVPGLAMLAEAIHGVGGKIAIQINPSAGRVDEVNPVAPSAIPYPLTRVTPRELTGEEIVTLIEQFGEGVARARRAGFDAVMVHGASGYLNYQFLSPLANKREDDYGGSIENRARFGRELVASAKRKAGKGFPLIFRICADDHMGGVTIDEALITCRILEEAGVDAIDVTSGVHQTGHWLTSPASVPPGYNRRLAKQVKSAVRLPVSVAGRINDPFLAEEILEQAEADFVTLGRTVIADPDFPNKARDGHHEEIRKCIACLNCTESILKKTTLVCTVNWSVGREAEVVSKPVVEKRKVLVIGGGPGGLEAARVASSRGHRVELWERSARLGGQLNIACVPPHKQVLRSVIDYELNQLLKMKVPLILNKEATPEGVIHSGAEVVVVATGASPAIPGIPGMQGAIDQGIAVTAWDILSGRIEAKNKVAVIGGNAVGCETAEFLADRGKDVTVIEMRRYIAPDLPGDTRRLLMARLKERNVNVLREVRCLAIAGPGKLELCDAAGKMFHIDVQNIVLATGAIANSGLYRDLKPIGLKIYEVGDCVKPRKLLDAISEGAKAGFDI